MAKKVAVLLSGCGVYDGSEIQEAVADVQVGIEKLVQAVLELSA